MRGNQEQRLRDPYADRTRSWSDIVDAMYSPAGAAEEGLAITQVNTACRIYGQAMGSLDFSMYRMENDEQIEVPDHSITKLFTKSINSYMTPFDWFVLSEIHLGITGNSTSYIVRNRAGNPIELLPIDPHDIVDVQLKNGVKTWVIGNDSRKIRDKDIFHIAGSGWDGVMGKNPIELHRSLMNTSSAMRKYLEKFFAQGASPKYVLETEEILDEEERNNISSSWHKVYAGPENAGKTVILENGLKVKPVSLSPVDTAYLQLMGNVTKQVANIYGLPLYMFNEFSEGAQYENVESQDLALIKYAIAPRAIKYEQEIQRKLIPDRTNYMPRFDLFSLSRGDMKTISEWVNRFFIIGTLNQDEIRKKYLNMNPLPNGMGKKFYVQGNNMVPIDKIDEIYDNKLQQPAVTGGGRPTEDEVDTDMPTIKE